MTTKSKTKPAKESDTVAPLATKKPDRPEITVLRNPAFNPSQHLFGQAFSQ